MLPPQTDQPRGFSSEVNERRVGRIGLCVRVWLDTLAGMKPFNIKLSDEHRAALEALRVQLGLRSEADVIRYWADHGAALLARTLRAERVAEVGLNDTVQPLVSTAKTVAPQGKTRDTAGKKTVADRSGSGSPGTVRLGDYALAIVRPEAV